MSIKIYDNRIVIPNSIKLSNMYENRSKYLEFDFTDVITKGNKYLVCKHESEQTFKTPLLLSDDKLIVKTFMNASPGTYKSLIIISDTTIDDNYDFSSDNLLFVSNMFDLIVDKNFLNGSSKEWELPDSINIKFDELLALISKVNEDLDSGAFDGVGIDSISKKSTQGNVDTYTITFTNGKTFEYNVTNGVDGKSPIVTVQNGNWFVNGEDTGQKAQGDKGERGEQGKSAYQIALDNGFVGSEQEWLDSLDYEHSEEFTQLANEVKQDAQTSTQAVETVTQIKTDVEDKVTEFEQTVQNANTDFDNKVNQVNSDLDTKIQQANATIDEKVTEATNQATKAKEEADRATLATDGKLDKNQGTDNVGKVMIVGEDGELTPTEYKSGSDNKLIGTVAKSENPNITDGYQAEMTNLKLYGKSEQGADPSPTSPQEITAISQFEGAPTGGNIVDWNIEQWNETVKQALNPIVTNDGLSINCNNLTTVLTPTIFGQYNVNTLKLDTSKKYIASCNLTNPNITIIVRTSSGQFALTSSHKQNVLPTGAEYIQQIFINFLQGLTFNGVISFQISVGDNVPLYTPYEAQPFEYTPTNQMYSTQDGSICDYVDVEKGVEVYNMIKQTLTTENVWTQYTADDSTRPFGKCYTTTLDFPFVNNEVMCDYLSYVQFAWKNATNPSISLSKYGKKIWVLCVVEYETLEEFTQWLSSNPMTIVFQAQIPTEIPINPIQLAILRALYTYNGVTNFLCNSDVSFDYEQSLQIVIQNIWNAIGQTNANILLGGNQ